MLLVRTTTPPRSRATRFAAALAAALVVLAALASVADARAFSQRFGQLARGDLSSASNSILTCTGGGGGSSSCSQARAGTGSVLDNANWDMVDIDVDGDGTTFNSSTAD